MNKSQNNKPNSNRRGNPRQRVAVQPVKPNQVSRARRQRRRSRAVQYSGAQTSSGPMIPASMPQQSSGQRHDTRLCARRELIQQVVGNTGFTTTLLPINAGLSQMFAWLSSDARRYEKYRFKELAFEYVNSVGPADATNAGGNVCLAVDFDALDSAPGTLQSMNQNETVRLFSPYDKVRMVVDPVDLSRRGWLYTRFGGVPSGSDAKTYDLGSLILATSNTSTNGLGNLFVDYVVELDVPQDVPVVGQKINCSTALSATALFGTTHTTTGIPTWTSDTAGVNLTCAVSGEYLFSLLITGTTVVCTTGGSSVGGTATSSEIYAAADGSATTAMYQFITRAEIGQTISPQINSAASISSVVVRVSAYRFNLG